jgi:hypothetical protein
MSRLIESLVAGAVVAAVVALLAWRVDSDLVLVPSAAFLVTFVALMLRGRTTSTGRRTVRRRR